MLSPPSLLLFDSMAVAGSVVGLTSEGMLLTKCAADKVILWPYVSHYFVISFLTLQLAQV